MKIETLHKRLKQKYKESVSEIEHITNGHFYPPSKRFFVTKKDLCVCIEQHGRDKCVRIIFIKLVMKENFENVSDNIDDFGDMIFYIYNIHVRNWIKIGAKKEDAVFNLNIRFYT